MPLSDEERKRKGRQYYKKNRKRLLKYQQEYRKRNTERSKTSHRKWAEKNREYLKKYLQRPEVKARRRKASREWARDNKKITKEKQTKTKFDVLSHYSKKISNSDIPCCACCGENSNLIFLTIDHIKPIKDPFGKKGKRVMFGIPFYANLRLNNFPDGYQVLCHNCNSAKSIYETCPHQRVS